jgi:hypothetical protein
MATPPKTPPMGAPKELFPVWALLLAISYQFEEEQPDDKQLSAALKQNYLKQLDKLHADLSHVIDRVESLANEIQMSLPKEPDNGDVSEQEPVTPP